MVVLACTPESDHWRRVGDRGMSAPKTRMERERHERDELEHKGIGRETSASLRVMSAERGGESRE